MGEICVPMSVSSSHLLPDKHVAARVDGGGSGVKWNYQTPFRSSSLA